MRRGHATATHRWASRVAVAGTPAATVADCVPARRIRAARRSLRGGASLSAGAARGVALHDDVLRAVALGVLMTPCRRLTCVIVSPPFVAAASYTCWAGFDGASVRRREVTEQFRVARGGRDGQRRDVVKSCRAPACGGIGSMLGRTAAPARLAFVTGWLQRSRASLRVDRRGSGGRGASKPPPGRSRVRLPSQLPTRLPSGPDVFAGAGVDDDGSGCGQRGRPGGSGPGRLRERDVFIVCLDEVSPVRPGWPPSPAAGHLLRQCSETAPPREWARARTGCRSDRRVVGRLATAAGHRSRRPFNGPRRWRPAGTWYRAARRGPGRPR